MKNQNHKPKKISLEIPSPPGNEGKKKPARSAQSRTKRSGVHNKPIAAGTYVYSEIVFHNGGLTLNRFTEAEMRALNKPRKKMH